MNDLIKYLLSEADFNRSCIDGRLGGDFIPSEDYILRRTKCAELFEGWASQVANFENRITLMKLVLGDCEGLLEAATKTDLDQEGAVTEQLEFVRKALNYET